MNSEWFGTVGALAGAAGGEGVRLAGRLRRGRIATKHRLEQAELLDAQKLREEIWGEMRELRRRLDDVNTELEKTRLAYIELMGKYTQLHAEHKALEREHAVLKARLTPPTLPAS